MKARGTALLAAFLTTAMLLLATPARADMVVPGGYENHMVTFSPTGQTAKVYCELQSAVDSYDRLRGVRGSCSSVMYGGGNVSIERIAVSDVSGRVLSVTTSQTVGNGIHVEAVSLWGRPRGCLYRIRINHSTRFNNGELFRWSYLTRNLRLHNCAAA